MGNLVELARPLLFAFINNCHTKKLVCDLIDKYVASTDNEIDDVIAKAVRTALMKGC